MTQTEVVRDMVKAVGLDADVRLTDAEADIVIAKSKSFAFFLEIAANVLPILMIASTGFFVSVFFNLPFFSTCMGIFLLRACFQTTAESLGEGNRKIGGQFLTKEVMKFKKTTGN
jgi:hypothetical protein